MDGSIRFVQLSQIFYFLNIRCRKSFFDQKYITELVEVGRGQHKTGSFGDDMLRPSPNHGTQRLPNDDDDDDDMNKSAMCV